MTAKQTLREKRMQAKLEKVEKMMEVHDFSLNAACKEAHIDRKTVRRWKKLEEKEEGKKLAYKFPGYKMPPRKKGYQELVKGFIDKHHGNVRLKDIQDYLQKDFEFKVSQQTLSYWINHNLNYTFKKAVTFSPDLTKMEFVAHQVAAAEELRKAIEFGLYLIFLDETAFTRNDGKAYGYGPKGKRVVFQHHKPTYTIGGIAATSQLRLEGFQLRDGKTNKLAFTHFVISLIKRLR